MNPARKEKRLKLLLNIAFINGLFWIGFYLYAIFYLPIIAAKIYRNYKYCEYKIFTKQNIEIYNQYSRDLTGNSCPDLEEHNFLLKNGRTSRMFDR